MARRPAWASEGKDWPNRAASRFILANGVGLHVQEMGAGAPLLLLHGAGAATHSWRAFGPILARHYHVIALDLPGHGFTGMPSASGLSVSGMARTILALLQGLNIQPQAVIGHSAGAALALRLALAWPDAPIPVIGLNAALTPFTGLAAHFAPAIAWMSSVNPVVVHGLAAGAKDIGRVRSLLAGTGSTIDEDGLRCYAALFQAPGHIEGVLGMMAQWDLRQTPQDIAALKGPISLIATARDRAVPPSLAADAIKPARHGEAIAVPALGHLAHEEQPETIATIVKQRLSAAGVAPD